MSFTIESVEIPSRKHHGSRLEYPISDLRPGTKDSFPVPVTESVKKTSASVRMFARRNGFKVTIREEDGNKIRVWRVS